MLEWRNLSPVEIYDNEHFKGEWCPMYAVQTALPAGDFNDGDYYKVFGVMYGPTWYVTPYNMYSDVFAAWSLRNDDVIIFIKGEWRHAHREYSNGNIADFTLKAISSAQFKIRDLGQEAIYRDNYNEKVSSWSINSWASIADSMIQRFDRNFGDSTNDSVENSEE